MRLSIPAEPHSLEPEAEAPRLRERSLLLALGQGCRVLVQDGLDCLRRPWSRLPTLRRKLWEEGMQLRRLLVEAPVAGLRGLVQRGCDWFARVRMARARAEGGNPPDPVRRIREALMTTSTNGSPPGNRELAEAVLILAEAVADNSKAVADNSKAVADSNRAMAQLHQELDTFRKEVETRFDGINGRLDRMDTFRKEAKTRFDGMDTRFDGVDTRFDGIDGRLDGMDTRFDGIDGRLDRMDTRFDGIDGRLDRMDTRFDGMDERLDGMDTRFDGIDRRLDRMDRKQDKMWGELGNQRGEVFERLAINALVRWLDYYCWERGRPEPEFEVLWSDRNNTEPTSPQRWRSVTQDLGIPARNLALHQCDILLRVTWPQPPHSSMHTVLLITGEVSTQLNQRRQEKVVRQYEALSEAGHAVLPVLIGLRHRTFVSIPNLMDVHLTEEELANLRDLTPPDDLYTLLDRLLDQPAARTGPP